MSTAHGPGTNIVLNLTTYGRVPLHSDVFGRAQIYQMPLFRLSS